jgi:hypothetical protein
LITLEGTFGVDGMSTVDNPVTIFFSGGVTEDATILGPHRARINVPPQATIGYLTTRVSDGLLSSLAFWRASFGLELQAFRASYEQADIARQAPSLVTARSDHASVVVNSFLNNSLYVLGGYSGGTFLNSVERATINADGSLGPFAIVPDVALATARAGHTCAVVYGWLYVFGGNDGSGNLDSIERAPIRSDDGSLGPFTIVPDVTLAVARSGHSSVVLGNSLYVFGGGDARVERATINADGSLGSFAIVPDVSFFGGFHPPSAVVGDSLYVIGNGGIVEKAPISPDGSLGRFAAILPPPNGALGSDHDESTSVVLGKFFYVLGGSGGPQSNFHTIARIDRAPLDGSAPLGAFTAAPGGPLSTARKGATSTVIGNYVYVLGGATDNQALNSVERAAINVGDSIGNFTPTSGVTLGVTRQRQTSAVLGNWLYELGGYSTDIGGVGGVNSVERAPITAAGLGAPFASVPGLTGAHLGQTSAVVGNWLYVLGGSTNKQAIERAAIAPAGSLGPFAVVTGVTLATPYLNRTAAIVGNKLYVLGGTDGSVSFTSVDQATIGPSGDLTSFTASGPLATPRWGHTSAVVGGYLYLFGGMNGSTVLNSLERAPIANGTVGSFAVVTPTLVTPRYWHTSAVVGSYLYIFGGLNASNQAVASVERARIAADGTVGLFTTVPNVQLDASLAGQANAVAGNTLYIVGGAGTGAGAHTAGTVQQASLQ